MVHAISSVEYSPVHVLSYLRIISEITFVMRPRVLEQSTRLEAINLSFGDWSSAHVVPQVA